MSVQHVLVFALELAVLGFIGDRVGAWLDRRDEDQ